MNPRAEIWNILHDGEIVYIQKVNSRDLAMTIEIPYLRQMISEGENIILILRDCSRFSMKIWEDDITTDDLPTISGLGAEILSTESQDSPVHIVTTHGEIDAAFNSFSLATDDGAEISFEVLCEACEKYWNRWEHEAKNAK